MVIGEGRRALTGSRWVCMNGDEGRPWDRIRPPPCLALPINAHALFFVYMPCNVLLRLSLMAISSYGNPVQESQSLFATAFIEALRPCGRRRRPRLFMMAPGNCHQPRRAYQSQTIPRATQLVRIRLGVTWLYVLLGFNRGDRACVAAAWADK